MKSLREGAELRIEAWRWEQANYRTLEIVQCSVATERESE
jgi:hypothetical protein